MYFISVIISTSAQSACFHPRQTAPSWTHMLCLAFSAHVVWLRLARPLHAAVGRSSPLLYSPRAAVGGVSRGFSVGFLQRCPYTWAIFHMYAYAGTRAQSCPGQTSRTIAGCSVYVAGIVQHQTVSKVDILIHTPTDPAWAFSGSNFCQPLVLWELGIFCQSGRCKMVTQCGLLWSLVWIYSSPPIHGGTLQVPQWMPESLNSTEPYLYYIFSCTHLLT